MQRNKIISTQIPEWDHLNQFCIAKFVCKFNWIGSHTNSNSFIPILNSTIKLHNFPKDFPILKKQIQFFP